MNKILNDAEWRQARLELLDHVSPQLGCRLQVLFILGRFI